MRGARRSVPGRHTGDRRSPSDRLRRGRMSAARRGRSGHIGSRNSGIIAGTGGATLALCSVQPYACCNAVPVHLLLRRSAALARGPAGAQQKKRASAIARAAGGVRVSRDRSRAARARVDRTGAPRTLCPERAAGDAERGARGSAQSRRTRIGFAERQPRHSFGELSAGPRRRLVFGSTDRRARSCSRTASRQAPLAGGPRTGS
jgi:hypothetical protein